MPRIWTDDEKAEIQTLSDEGLSLKQIGERFSVSDDTIRGVLRRKRAAEQAASGAQIDLEAGEGALPRLTRTRVASGPCTTTDRLRAIHEKFNRDAPDRRSSSPVWVVKKDDPRS